MLLVGSFIELLLVILQLTCYSLSLIFFVNVADYGCFRFFHASLRAYYFTHIYLLGVVCKKWAVFKDVVLCSGLSLHNLHVKSIYVG